MVAGYLVDSDWIIDVFHGQANATQTLVALAPFGLAVSHVSYAELYEGSYYSRTAAQDLATLQTFLISKELLPVTLSVAERFAVLRGSLSRPVRQQVGDMDLLIAATALEYDLTLLTRNLRDFQRIPGFQLYAPP